MKSSDLKFWKKKSSLIYWKRKPKKIIEIKKKTISFYKDGKTNIAYNCIKKNINEGRGDKIALILLDQNNQKKILTFNELENLVNHFINYIFSNFKDKKIFDYPVAIHSSANLCSVVSMLACMKLGVPHCVIFDDLSKEAIEIRCKLINCKLLITSTNEKDYKKKIIQIKKKLGIKVIRFSNLPEKKLIINTDNFYEKKKLSSYYKYKFVSSNHKSFILFTSGSTGEPKGIVHSTGGYLVYSKYTCIEKFNITKKSIILTASDAGWINGHTYALYGPLSLGATTIILEKPLDLLDQNVLKKVLIDFKVNILYLPVTLIRLIKALKNQINIKSKYLKLLGSMGEPLSKFVGSWFCKKFSNKKLQIVNTYFQTETGGIISSPSYKDTLSKVPFGTVGKPITKKLGVFLKKNKSEIKITKPWPGCLIDVINNKKLFYDYWDEKKRFRLFDLASLDENNNFVIHGRVDDVINISGHRIGSGEIESVILKLNYVKEVCAVSVDDELSGKKLIIFLVSKRKNISKNIDDIILRNFGSYAIPEKIIFLSELPKTRSGKILRRILRNIFMSPNTKKIGDISTILNYGVISEIRKAVKN